MLVYKANCKEMQVNVEVELKNRILDLEGELKKQRERCMTIIEEKEDEVNMLKSNMETTLEAAFRAAAKTAANSALAKEISHFENNDYNQKIKRDSNSTFSVDEVFTTNSGSIIETSHSNNCPSTNTDISSTRRSRRSKSGSVSRDHVRVFDHKIRLWKHQTFSLTRPLYFQMNINACFNCRWQKI